MKVSVHNTPHVLRILNHCSQQPWTRTDSCGLQINNLWNYTLRPTNLSSWESTWFIVLFLVRQNHRRITEFYMIRLVKTERKENLQALPLGIVIGVWLAASRHIGCVTFPCHVIHLITVMTTTSTSCTSAWHVSITKPQLLFSNWQYLTQLSLWCTSECYDPSTDDVLNVEQNSGAHTKKSHCSKHITGCNYLYPHSTAGYTRTFSPLSPPMLPISRVVSHRQWSKVVPLMWLASYEHTWEKMPMMLVVWSSHKRG